MSAVVNCDADHASEFVAAAERRGLRLVTVGVQGETLKLGNQVPHARGQDLSVLYRGQLRIVALPLAGLFQASNALVAAGLALGLGDPADEVFAALAKLQGAPGRLELVAQTRSGASIYVDYAHTPDAIETVLLALRPHVKGRLHIIFGCGGDRDRGKRPLMAAGRRALRRFHHRDRTTIPARKIRPRSGAKCFKARPMRARSAIARKRSASALPRLGPTTRL